MKKIYIKPAAKVVLLNVKDDIADKFMGNSKYVPLDEEKNDDDYDFDPDEQY